MNAITNGVGNMAGPSNHAVLHGLDYPFMQVREFHEAFGHPIATSPQVLDRQRMENRAKWMREEIDEFLDPASHTPEDGADAMIDLIYFALGTLVEMGIMPQPIMDPVHNANMAKMHLIDGERRVVKNEDGKVIKPQGWEENHAPERHIAAEIERQSIAQPLNAMCA